MSFFKGEILGGASLWGDSYLNSITVLLDYSWQPRNGCSDIDINTIWICLFMVNMMVTVSITYKYTEKNL